MKDTKRVSSSSLLPPSSSLLLSTQHFQSIVETVYQQCGINLRSGKEELVKSRLMRRLRALQMASFDEYLRFVDEDETGVELTMMIDCLTTNKTDFFREPRHFDYLARAVLPRLTKKKLRVWSAGCSTGEEPYTIGIHLREHLSNPDQWDVKILATDISTRVLEKARSAIYAEETLAGLSPELINDYFNRTVVEGVPCHEVVPAVRRMVSFARLNLMGEWPMKGPFDVIFCRNVMIYFEKAIQERLIERFHHLLAPGGHLFVGHSESMAGIAHRFAYVQPATYCRREA